MGSHFDDVRDLINQRKPADSFANHCAKFLEGEGRVRRSFARKQVQCVEVLWKGNPLSCVKTFKSLTCKLCMKERFLIYEAKRNEEEEGTCHLINSCNKFYGACRHIPRFHRYQRYDTSTDEGGYPEKIEGEISTGSFSENTTNSL